MNKKIIGAKLMKLRGDKTRSLVARELEISESALAMYESGHRTPRDEIKVRIANYYKRTVQEIFLKINFTKRAVNLTQHRRRTFWLISVSHLITYRTKRFSKLLKRFAKKLISKAWRTAQKIHLSSNIKKHSFARDFSNQIGSGDKADRYRVFPEIKNNSSQIPT
ncbi:helix-turn-helix transcriptional regulator [Bacillus licheniformis]